MKGILNFADFMHRCESTTAKLLKSDHKIRHVDLQAPGGIDGNRSIQEQILPIKYMDGTLLQTCGVWWGLVFERGRGSVISCGPSGPSYEYRSWCLQHAQWCCDKKFIPALKYTDCGGISSYNVEQLLWCTLKPGKTHKVDRTLYKVNNGNIGDGERVTSYENMSVEISFNGYGVRHGHHATFQFGGPSVQKCCNKVVFNRNTK